MYHDAIVVLLIVVIIPICVIMTLRVVGKEKRHRRPVQNFYLR
jgi:hypothetical protein